MSGTFRENGVTTAVHLVSAAALAGLALLSAGCSGESDGAKPPKQTASKTTSDAGPSQGASESPDPPPQKVADPPPQKPEPAIIYRPDDARPQHDDQALADLGIHLYESRRLKLYSDLPPELVRPLPELMDRAYAAWEEYFGPLPPDRAESDFQMTGYIMRDRRLFLETGLLPDDLPDFPHGRHRGAEFWMNEQEHDFYRRHLMVHEGTHCFMTIMPQVSPPLWYIEGMAELFGTHRTSAPGRSTFRIMPGASLDVRGWGRLQILAGERSAGRVQSLDEIFAYSGNSFLETKAYVWSWALCKFLDTHPRYRDRFHELRDYQEGSAFVRRFQEVFQPDQVEMNRDWAFFAADLDYGYDVERSVIDWKSGRALEVGSEAEDDVAADRGWQSSGLSVKPGETYEISADGRVVLAVHPRPWESEADGVTIRYHADRPLGMLMARIVPDTVTKIAQKATVGVGKRNVLTPTEPGTLYFRVNDFWGELADNSGAYRVKVRRLPSPPKRSR